MRPEKDRDWELPLGNDGVVVAVLMDIRDELKGLIHEITELTKIVAAHKVHQMEKNMVDVMNQAQAKGLIEDAVPTKAYPPPAPTPPPKPVHTARRKR